MCVLGLVRSGQRDNPKEIRRACGRSAGSIDNAGRIVPVYRFLLVPFKTNKLCIGESLTI